MTDDDDDWSAYESGPFCAHWSDSDCGKRCGSCGHWCHSFNGDCRECECDRCTDEEGRP